MASGSRLHAGASREASQATGRHNTLFLSDSNDALFLAVNNVGIAATETSINGETTWKLVHAFIENQCVESQSTVEVVGSKLLKYFRQFQPIPKALFVVAGSKGKAQQVGRVQVDDNESLKANPVDQQGASFGGETDIVLRLLQPVGEIDKRGQMVRPLPHFESTLALFALPDAIDFSISLVRTQIEAVRFQKRAKSVGGPIDVLLLPADRASWIQRKQLHGQ